MYIKDKNKIVIFRNIYKKGSLKDLIYKVL